MNSKLKSRFKLLAIVLSVFVAFGLVLQSSFSSANVNSIRNDSVNEPQRTDVAKVNSDSQSSSSIALNSFDDF